MKKILLSKCLKIVAPLKMKLYHLKKAIQGRERKISLGVENPDKIFYVTGQDDLCGGLFWLVNKVVMHIAYALDCGYVTVVDYKNHLTQYSYKRGEENIWELFFKQPFGYNLEDISRSRNIVINKMTPSPKKKYLMGQTEFYDNPNRIEYFRRIFKKYIIFNEHTKQYLDSVYNKYLEGKGEVIGVLCRGTDYLLLKPKGHPIQPEPEMVINDVKKIMSSCHCKHVFLATEDEDILNMFKSEFKDNLIYMEQKRISKSCMCGDLYLSQEKELDKSRDKFDDAMKYLAAIYLLSKCDYFIGGRTGGTKGVLLMSEEFKYQKIYDLGLYK